MQVNCRLVSTHCLYTRRVQRGLKGGCDDIFSDIYQITWISYFLNTIEQQKGCDNNLKCVWCLSDLYQNQTVIGKHREEMRVVSLKQNYNIFIILF